MQKARSSTYYVPLSAHLFLLRLPSGSSAGLTKENTVGWRLSHTTFLRSEQEAILSVTVTPAMQLGHTLWPLTLLIDCLLRDAQLLFY